METMELRWLLFWVFLGNVKCANTMEPPSIIEYCSWSSNSPGRSLSSPRDLPRKVQSRQWCDWKFSQILLMECFWWEPQVTSIFYMFYDPTTRSLSLDMYSTNDLENWLFCVVVARAGSWRLEAGWCLWWKEFSNCTVKLVILGAPWAWRSFSLPIWS